MNVRMPPSTVDPRNDQAGSNSYQPDAVTSRWKDILQEISSALDRLDFLAEAIRTTSAMGIEYSIAVLRGEDDVVFRRDATTLVRGRFPAARKSICQQLGDSIAVRRTVLLQKHRHRGSLTVRQVVDSSVSSKQSHNLEPEFRPAESHPARHMLAANPRSTAIGVTKAPRSDQVTSTVSTTQNDLFVYPPPPKPDEGQTQVQCPYCLMTLDYAEIKNEGSEYWMHHVDEDLQPYSCLFPECAKAFVFFAGRHEWNSHMERVHYYGWPQRVHTSFWFCDINHDPPEQFETEMMWRKHMKNLHSHPERRFNEVAEFQLDALSLKKERHIIRDRFVCPLCEQIPDKIRPTAEKGTGNLEEAYAFLSDHIGNHTKSLSLLAVPCMDITNGTDEESIVMKDSFRRIMNEGSVPQPPSAIELMEGVSLPSEASYTLDREDVAPVVFGSESAWDKESSDYTPPDPPLDMVDFEWTQAWKAWKELRDRNVHESLDSDPVIEHFIAQRLVTNAAETIPDSSSAENYEVDYRDPSGRTPLSEAAEAGHAADVSLLLERGADINAVDRNRRTPLLWAAKNGQGAAV